MSTKTRKKRASELTPLQQNIVDSIKSCKSLMGKGGALTSLIKGALEAALDGEMAAHLSCGDDA